MGVKACINAKQKKVSIHGLKEGVGDQDNKNKGPDQNC